MLNVIGPIQIEAPKTPHVSRTYPSYLVPAIKPVTTPVVVVKLVSPVVNGVKPLGPTIRFQLAEPPVVHENVAVEEVTSVSTKFEGSGQSG